MISKLRYTSYLRVKTLTRNQSTTPSQTIIDKPQTEETSSEIGAYDGAPKQNVSPYANDSFPYTRTLFQKNYLKYTKQSYLRVQHDHVYDQYERIPTLEERLKEYEDPLNRRSTVNIGYIPSKLKQTSFRHESNEKFLSNKKNPKLEKDSFDMNIQISLDQVNNDWKETDYHEQVLTIAEHYNIYKDLYDSGYFFTMNKMDIEYENGVNVAFGNRIQAKNTSNCPKINLKNLQNDKFYSLTLMNLDGNLIENDKEVLLWFKSNLSVNDLNGQDVFKYLAPFPMKGTGWHRCAYVLYEHSNQIDFSNDFFHQIESPNEIDLKLRSFKTYDFYLKYQKEVTPVSLLFFQSHWDSSVRDTFHNILNMKEPSYEYDFGPKFISKQERYYTQGPFNWYLQQYQDKKQVNEEMLRDYLKQLSPFEPYEKPLEYPLMENYEKNIHRWYKYEWNEYRLREGRYSTIPFKYFSEQQNKLRMLKQLPYQEKLASELKINEL